MLAIDHVVVYVNDLESAADRLERRYGLTSVPGGVHAGLGTANRIVPFGRDYLELLTVIDPESFARTGLAVPEQPRLWGWMARASDFDDRAERLGLGVVPMSRDGDGGAALSWRLAGMEHIATEPSLPVLIDWDVDEPEHPARVAVSHPRPVSGIAWLELRGDVQSLDRCCGDRSGLPLRVTSGAPEITAVGLAVGDGGPEVELRAPLDL